MGEIITNRDFGLALCNYFGLPLGQVGRDVAINAGCADIFGVTLTIALTASDMKGIADRIGLDVAPISRSVGPTIMTGHAVFELAPSWYGCWRDEFDGFDSWYRNRIDAAHAAYMERHAMGGLVFSTVEHGAGTGNFK